MSAGEYLFSGSYDKTIRKWNREGECVGTFTHHTGTVTSLAVHNGELWSSSYDTTVKRCSLEGTVLQEYKGHTNGVLCLVVWRGAVFSGGYDKQVIQWTPFAVWSPSTHHQFSREEREGIKTMMLMAKQQHFPSAALPTELLHIIFQYYTSIPLKSKEESHLPKESKDT